MSLWSSINTFFAPNPNRGKGAAAAAAAAAAATAIEIPVFAMGLIVNPQKATALVQQVEAYKRLPEEKKVEQMLPLYLELEEHIIQTDPLKKHSRESIRKTVRETADFDRVKLPYKGLFLLGTEASLIIFRMVFSKTASLLYNILGAKAMESLLLENIANTPLKGTAILENSLDVDVPLERLQHKPCTPENMETALMRLCFAIAGKAVEMHGEEALKTLHRNFELLQKEYHFPAESMASMQRILAEIQQNLSTQSAKKSVVPVSKHTKKMFASLGFESLIQKGVLENTNTMLITKKGEEVPVNLAGSAITNEDGSITGMVVTVRDLSEVKKYAAKRLQSISPVLQSIAMGDFSKQFHIPKQEDEFTSHLKSINLMVEDLQKLQKEQKQAVQEKVELETQLQTQKAQDAEEKSTELKELVDRLKASEQQLKATNQQLGASNQQLTASEERLQGKLLELERFNKVAVGRELKMVELKKELAALKKEQSTSSLQQEIQETKKKIKATKKEIEEDTEKSTEKSTEIHGKTRKGRE
jgi:hypothetical protein